MIVKRIGLNEFIEAFKEIDRDYFSYEGYEALYEYLEELSDDIGEPIELDPVAITCDYVEYSSVDEFNADYKTSCSCIDDIWDYTQVIKFKNGFIIQVF